MAGWFAQYYLRRCHPYLTSSADREREREGGSERASERARERERARTRARTPALCTRAPPHGAPSLRHTGRETRPRDAAAPHTSPPGSLVCIGVGQHVVVNAAVALAALPVPWHRRVGATPGSIPNITVGRAERASEPGTEGERERESERESERATTCDLSASQHTQMMPCARVHADTTR